MESLILVSVVLLSALCAAQGTQDQQAISVLNSCLTASGGLAAINGVQDFSASGNVTYYWANQNVQGNVTLKALDTSNFRIDAVLQAGTLSWAVSNGNGALIDTDGTRTTVPSYNGINVGILSWRLPNIVAALGNSAATLSYMGVVQSDAGQAIQIHYVLPDNTNPDPSLANLNTIDYFFDPSTYYLLDKTSWVLRDIPSYVYVRVWLPWATLLIFAPCWLPVRPCRCNLHTSPSTWSRWILWKLIWDRTIMRWLLRSKGVMASFPVGRPTGNWPKHFWPGLICPQEEAHSSHTA